MLHSASPRNAGLRRLKVRVDGAQTASLKGTTLAQQLSNKLGAHHVCRRRASLLARDSLYKSGQAMAIYVVGPRCFDAIDRGWFSAVTHHERGFQEHSARRRVKGDA